MPTTPRSLLSARLLLAVVLLLVLSIAASCTRYTRKGVVGDAGFGHGKAQLREVFPWQGETLEYDVNISNVKAMSMSLTASRQGKADDGTPYIALYGEGRTFGLFALGYPLEDWAKTFIHPRTWMPYHAIKSINERGKHRRYHVHYWHDEHLATIEKWTPEKTTQRRIAIPGMTFDVISFIYILRQIPFESGHTETWVVYDGWKLNHIYLVAQEREKIVTEAGVFNAFRVDIYRELLSSTEAQGALAGAFVEPEISIKKKRYFAGNLWISDDPQRLPIQLSLETRLGEINVKLTKHSAPTTQ